MSVISHLSGLSPLNQTIGGAAVE